MRVKRLNQPSFFERNRHFNEAAAGLVNDIFEHQAVHETGYVAARTSSSFLPDDISAENSQSEIENGGSEHYDTAGLGEYERRILSRIMIGKYRTIVLRGDMGSGKSATIDCLANILRNRLLDTRGARKIAPIVIKLNFNAGYQISDLNAVMKEFHQELYDQLRYELRRLFAESSLSNAFRDTVIADRAKVGEQKAYSAFDRFVQTHEDSVEWKKKSESQKANLLFSYIDECTENGTQRMSILMALIRFTKESLRPDPGTFILIFDNIDSVQPEAQSGILYEILGYLETAQVQALVSLRRSTFARFDPRSIFPFETIDHLGPSIKEVILRRFDYYLKKWEVLPEVNVLPAEYRSTIKARLEYLIGIKNDPRGAIYRSLPICGASIRAGLFMCERFFINSGVPFNEDPRYKDDLVRAVLVGNSESNKISADDSSIANLLLNKATGVASLINLRILQLITASDTNEAGCSIRSLLEILQVIGGWSVEETRIAINYLLYVRRPLIWVDGKTKYDTLTDRDADDLLHLTEAGDFYLRRLVLDLVYIQEATLSIDWPGREIPSTIDWSREVERFQVLRSCLNELAQSDYEQTSRLKKWLSSQRTTVAVGLYLYINRMIAAVGNSVLNILNVIETRHRCDEQMKLEIMEELRNWSSMINKWLDAELHLLGTPNKMLEQLSRKYRHRIT